MGAAAADPLSFPAAILAAFPDETLSHLRELRFDAPARAWLALPVLAVLFVAVRVRRRNGALPASVLRAAGLAALLAVLCDPYYMERGEREGAVVVVADTSPSVGDRGLEQLRAWLPAREVVAFGDAPRLARAIEADEAPVTDIAAALRFAAASAGPVEPLRLLLLSDGRATRPGAQDAARRLRARDVEIAAVGIPDAPPPAPPSFHVRRLHPRAVDEPGLVPTLVARVASSAATSVEATLYLDGREAGRWTLALAAGEQEIPLPPVAVAPGRYHAQILLAGDHSPDDNAAATTLHVEGAPRILCLAADARRSLVADALRAQGMDVTVAAADAALEGFDAVVVLPDADARVLDERSADLAAFVGERGGGLLALGSGEGPGLARVAGSPFAFLLPVEVEPRRAPPEKPKPPADENEPTPKIEIKEEKTQAYPITLCLVVDRSGSMQGEKFQRAKAAAAAAAEALTDQDRIAVVAFGDEARVVLGARAGGRADPVVRTLAPLVAEGRTAMFAALSLAYELLEEEVSPIRHIVLISDGVPTDGGRWRDLVIEGQSRKVTLSCVGIGFEVDRRHLGRLSSWGRGKLWSVVHANEIPQVVTQDTLRVVRGRDERGKDAERNAPRHEDPPPPEGNEKPDPAPRDPGTAKPPEGVAIRLDAAAPRGMFKGIAPADLPEVAAVEASKPRFASWVAARAGDDALVAFRRVGLGTSGALLVDPETPGGQRLREHAEFPRMMAQLVRSVLPDRPAATVQVTTRLLERGERLAVEVFGEDGRARTDLPLALAVGDLVVPTVRRSERYEAELPPRDAVTPARIRIGGEASPMLERTFVLPPSRDPEMGATGIDEEALRALAGGPLTTDVAAALTPPRAPTSHRRPFGLPFLALAAILLPLDAWARRRARSASPSRRATPTASDPK